MSPPRPSIEVHLDAPELGEPIQVGCLFPADVRIEVPPEFRLPRVT